jgi:hypothetical protein
VTPGAIVAALPAEQVGAIGTDKVRRVVGHALGQVVKSDRVRVATRTGLEGGTVEGVVFRGEDRAGRERWLATVAIDVPAGERPRWVELPSWEDIEWELLPSSETP